MAVPVVSILMSVYNAAPYLDEALASLLRNQTFTRVEVLAVDDASTDASLSILKRWEASDSRLRVFCQPSNQGQGVARNVALGQARGEFITMVDADDWLSPDALQAAVDVFRHWPETDCVLFRLMLHWQESGREEAFPIDFSVPYLSGEEAFRRSLGWKIHGLCLVRRELHLRYPYDTHYRLYSDDNTCRLHYLHSREVRLCEGIYYWRRHEKSSTTQFSADRFLHMMANLDLQRTLENESVAHDVVDAYEQIRWHNYLSLLWLRFARLRELKEEERARVREDFRQVYRSFHRSVPYALHVAGQWLRYRLRRLLARFSRQSLTHISLFI